MSTRPGNGSLEFGRSLQEKYEMYLTGLIFTLLAASIHTANFTEIPLQNALELAAWLVLGIAGLTSLSRLEWLPSSHVLHGKLSNTRELVRGVRDTEARGGRVLDEDTGNEINPAEYIARQTEMILKAEKIAAFDSLTIG